MSDADDGVVGLAARLVRRPGAQQRGVRQRVGDVAAEEQLLDAGRQGGGVGADVDLVTTRGRCRPGRSRTGGTGSSSTSALVDVVDLVVVIDLAGDHRRLEGLGAGG